jgi:heparan-alpha-glucosaminide N-acetyltransferase
MNPTQSPDMAGADAPFTLQNQMPVQRILAIDTFRGITMLVMIFVNTLAGTRGIPAWMEHMPADVDGMTFVDAVFPAFLFIVGMSIPFAFAQRLRAGDTPLQLQGHMLARTLGLLVLGVFMVNAEEGYNEQAMHMSIYLWNLLFYVAAILVWNVYRFQNKAISIGLRAAGALGLVVLACIFRGGADGNLYLAPQWWGILGLIGWAYLFSGIFYQLCKGRIAPLLGALLFCVAYYCIAQSDAVKGSAVLQLLTSQAVNASHTSITLCGLIVSLIFFDRGRTKTVQRTVHKRFVDVSAFALLLLAAGYVLRPYFKISKIYATPTWCLYSSAICIAIFALLYWLIDLKKWQAWTAFFRPAAANPLLVYIIPYIVYALMQYLHLSLPDVFGEGVPGMLWSASYAVAVMVLAIGLNRLHIKLQL